MKRCYFIAQGNINNEQINLAILQLVGLLPNLIDKGYERLTVGFQSNIDFALAKIICDLKKENKNIIFEIIVPDQETLERKHSYSALALETCDGVGIINQGIVITYTDLIVAIWDGKSSSDIYNIVEFAKERKKEVISIHI